MTIRAINILLRKVSEGDHDAFGRLHNEYFKKCFTIALYFVHNPDSAEDIVSEVFLTLWEKRLILNKIDNWESFLFIMTRNHALKFMRKNKKNRHDHLDVLEVSLTSTDLTPEDAVLRKEYQKVMDDAMRRLPGKSQMVYYMAKEEKMSYKEIANILDISERTVNWHMTTVVQRLAESLKGYFK